MAEPGPKRIQLSRKVGWRKPADAIVVARPTRWGSPLRVDPANPRGRLVAVQRFSLYLTIRRQTGSDPIGYPSDERIRAELAGRDLCCWCPTDGPCHADVLLEIANDREPANA